MENSRPELRSSEHSPLPPSTVVFVAESGGERSVSIAEGATLLQAALAGDIPIFHDCNGKARCTTCRVRVISGELPPRTEEEAEIAQMSGWPDEIRLACQLQPANSLRVQRMMRQEVQRAKAAAPGEEERSVELPLAVLFCDVEDFTQFAAKTMPYDVVHVINRIFFRVGDAVLSNSGYIDKYLGDGLMALWGVHGGAREDLALNAIRAALLMRQTVRELSEHLQTHFDAEFFLRIGIHFGPAIVGRIGHPAQQHLTAIGDTVNIASRVEAQNKQLRTNLLVTAEFYEHVRDSVTVGDDFKTVLRGQDKPQRLYEITGLAHPDPVWLVQSQIHRVLLDGQHFVERFYREFFTRAPEVRPLFAQTNLRRQHQLFVNQLAWCVRELRNPSELHSHLAALGERHHAYGMRPEHILPARDALIAALEETLRPDFDAVSRGAWSGAIEAIAGAMQERRSSTFAN